MLKLSSSELMADCCVTWHCDTVVLSPGWCSHRSVEWALNVSNSSTICMTKHCWELGPIMGSNQILLLSPTNSKSLHQRSSTHVKTAVSEAKPGWMDNNYMFLLKQWPSLDPAGPCIVIANGVSEKKGGVSEAVISGGWTRKLSLLTNVHYQGYRHGTLLHCDCKAGKVGNSIVCE